MNRWSRIPTTSAGWSRTESGVKSTTSANRIDAATNWSAIVAVSALSLSAIERGRMFRSRFSARSCSTRSAATACSRCRTNCTRSPNTTEPATVTLSAIINGANHAGNSGPLSGELAYEAGHQEDGHERDEPAHAGARAVEHERPERRESCPTGPRRPTRGSRRRTPSRSSARAGMSSSSTRRNDSVLRVREKIAIATDRDGEVEPGDEARPRPESEVDRVPRRPRSAGSGCRRRRAATCAAASRRRHADRHRFSPRDRSTAGRTERTRPCAEGNRSPHASGAVTAPSDPIKSRVPGGGGSPVRHARAAEPRPSPARAVPAPGRRPGSAQEIQACGG